jgi:hypothetical protein
MGQSPYQLFPFLKKIGLSENDRTYLYKHIQTLETMEKIMENSIDRSQGHL